MSAFVPLLAGVLVAGLFLGGAGLGAAVLRLIGGLTGGRWSETPILAAMARYAPFPLLLAFAARAGLALARPGAGYLAEEWLVLRLLAAAAIWTLVARIGAGRPARALGAGALVVFGFSLPVMGFDLIDSLEPSWVSSAAAYTLGVRMLGAALAAALLLSPPDGQDRSDLQGLLVTTLLATLYLDLMSYLVPWYGDLPDKTGAIRERSGPGWQALIVLALGIGALAPLPLLALRRRLGGGAARAAAGLALLGFGLQTAWLVAPPFGAWAAALSIFLAFAGAAVSAALAGSLRSPVHA